MLAFHNEISIKEKYISRVRDHLLADEIQKGFYWERGKGCAVGCTIHGSDHSKYEIELGIPRILAKLEDGIFENIPNERAKIWPGEFLEAINVGSNLSSVWPKFAIWLLTDEKYGVLQYAKSEKYKKLIQLIADYYSKYKEINFEQWHAAADAADAYAADADTAAYAANAATYAANAAAYAANAAAYYAAYAADAANAYAAAYSANAAANAAAYYAAYAADAANAYATAYAANAYDANAYADAAAYDADAASAAKTNIRLAHADKLLDLLKECR
jgi:hypothetical protein